MNLANNPFAVLTLISAPAVLTNASCVLLFGTGNRYGRAVDRVHELADLLRDKPEMGSEEYALRSRQLGAGETRAMFIVRALTCFYTAVAGFVASTLICLVGALLVNAQQPAATTVSFCTALLAGVVGVVAMITGSLMLARETRYSFAVLKEERVFLQSQVRGNALAQNLRGRRKWNFSQVSLPSDAKSPEGKVVTNRSAIDWTWPSGVLRSKRHRDCPDGRFIGESRQR